MDLLDPEVNQPLTDPQSAELLPIPLPGFTNNNCDAGEAPARQRHDAPGGRRPGLWWLTVVEEQLHQGTQKFAGELGRKRLEGEGRGGSFASSQGRDGRVAQVHTRARR